MMSQGQQDIRKGCPYISKGGMNIDGVVGHAATMDRVGQQDSENVTSAQHRGMTQDSASAPTPRASNPCPYRTGTWYLIGDGILPANHGVFEGEV